MEEPNGKRDLGYYCIEIIKDKEGNPLIIVKFRHENKAFLAREHSWCPTSEELEFLYRTMKWMEKSTPKIQTPDTQFYIQQGKPPKSSVGQK
jgi:hypothetical protein